MKTTSAVASGIGRSLSRAFCVFQLIFILAGSGSSSLAAPLHGLEVEFASETLLEADPERISESHYKKPLEFVREAYKDPDGEIFLEKWRLYAHLKAKSAAYVDPLGRKWQIVPESVNTTGLDGFEFITPPIETDEDRAVIQKVLTQIRESGLYGKGLRSSVHVTISVGHLFSETGDASKLVDTILFIENHWPEIYAAVSPMRYGTIVNRFSIPLAVEQKELLTALGRLSEDERTYPKLKSLFESYQEKELQFKQNWRRHAWKYRAANYRKLFGLGGTGYLPVIEFRILDFQDPAEIHRLVTLFLSIIEKGHSIQPDSKFYDPFASLRGELDLDAANRLLYHSDSSSYEEFIRSLGLSSAQYPRYKTYSISPFFGPSKKALKNAYSNFDPTKPHLYRGTPFTYGWELEMRGEGVKEVVVNLEKKKLRLDRFPFLDGTVDLEDTGNVEVRSKPTQVLSDAIHQMQTLRDVVKRDVAGYHLHMRVPKALTDSLDKREFEGWLSRVSDAIYAWRLQYRSDEYALKAYTQVRRAPFTLDEKGTLTVKTIGSSTDIEIRGFMNDVEQIQSFAEIIIVGLLNPELIQGFTDFQLMLHFQKQPLIEVMADFVEKYQQRPLKKDEIYLLRDLNDWATKDGVLPLFGFEHSPVFSDLDRVKIQDSNFEFRKAVLELLRDVMVYKKYERQTNEFYEAFRLLIKHWAKSIRFYQTLKGTLLYYPMNTSQFIQKEDFINKLIIAGANTGTTYLIGKAAKDLLRRLPMDVFFKSINASLKHKNPVMRRLAISLLTEVIIDRAKGDLERRKRAAALVFQAINQALQQAELESYSELK